MVVTQTKPMKIWSTLGWVAVVLSALILLASGIVRFVLMAQDTPSTDTFDIRYVQHPWVTFFHIVPGVLFLLLAPLQFVARIRQRRINYHRIMGRVLVTSAAISGGAALVINFLFPAFGGVSTQAATVFFFTIFLFSLTKAFLHIRRKEVRSHREWMIRTLALAMGVASIRLFIPLLQAITGLDQEEAFGTSFWLGFGVNMVVAELWINYTRVKDR